MKSEDSQLEDLIRIEIKNFVKNSRGNWLGPDFSEPAWAEPLIGIGSAAELSVVSWVLPQTEETKRDQRWEKRLPSKRWMCSRSYGQDFNDLLSHHLVEWFRNSGIDAVSPSVNPYFKRAESSKYGFASVWSERHTAFAAGLGSFGLCDGLITPLDKAVRLGSIILKAVLPQQKKDYSHQYCLFYQNSTCGECMSRCPAGAISKMGHNKIRCNDYIQSNVQPYGLKTVAREITGCGLCQTAIPCESSIPKRINK